MKDIFYSIPTTPSSPIPSFTESAVSSSRLVKFGSLNKFPNDIQNLIESVSILRSLIEGSSLVSESNPTTIPSNTFTSSNFLLDIFTNLFSHSSAFILVRRSRDNAQLHLSVLPSQFVRVDDTYSTFYYSESDFRSRSEYPNFKNDPFASSSVLPILLSHSGRVYPLPIFSSALREIVTLRDIAEFHASSLANGFTPSAIISMCNGEPSADEKETLERKINSKFSGANNAGRLVITFADDKEHAPEVTSFSTEDVSSRYSDLREHCLKSLFSAFRATPSLFGIPDGAASALSETEYQAQAQLFYVFTLRPIMNVVSKALYDAFSITYEVRNPFKTLFTE